jgi:hypothetical protein
LITSALVLWFYPGAGVGRIFLGLVVLFAGCFTLSESGGEKSSAKAVLLGALIVGGATWGALSLIAAGGTGHPVHAPSAVKNVDRAVFDAHKNDPWFDHIDEVRDGFTVDVEIFTDLEETNASELRLAVAACSAYVAAMKTAHPSVEVLGDKTTKSKAIDGSTRTKVEHKARIASADYNGKCT